MLLFLSFHNIFLVYDSSAFALGRMAFCFEVSIFGPLIIAYRGSASPYKPRDAMIITGLFFTRIYKIMTILISNVPIKMSLRSKNFFIVLYIKIRATINKKSIFNSSLIAGKRTMN